METPASDIRKKRIGIYSGTFNPIHLGHQKLAEYLVENKHVDEVWFVVSPCNPLKEKSEIIDEYIRLDMVILAISGNPAFKASDVEFLMPVPSYSVDTLHELSIQYPEFQFVMIIGSDNALVFDQWKDYTKILQEYPVLVYPRKGFEFSLVARKYPAMQLVESPCYEISSTVIRHSIAQKKDISQWLNPSVFQFIEENNLYR
ncbi:MAG TPA: nicotinate (nicotinamide) nucleotide adenylyltransferase [Paludibacter sp.]|nr:nicotinate (nicotinamide) nucleotide adenylyltransferase [Paludibacter sp.]